ncbi:MAG: Rpn family recombination-promoting nuclease/putative transposase [Polyangiales bacterium]
MHLLDPKNDAVFKMLLARPENRRLLVSLIESVLRPPSPVRVATVLNPELPRELVDDRGVFLDVLVELEDGARVNIEMQCDPRGALGQRWLYNWARLFSKGIKEGDAFADLAPVACITFLDTSPHGRFHERFRALETETHRCLSDAFEIHLIELPLAANASQQREGADLVHWARFLRARTEAELDSLARGDPIMAEAKAALERLSEDPEAQYIAEKRRDGEIYLRGVLREAHAEGELDGLRKAIVAFCAPLGIELDSVRREELAGAGPERLESILTHLATHRTWPH